MHQRVFIAIELPAEIKAHIREVLTADKKAHPDLYINARMIPEEDWHITLSFLGTYAPDMVKDIEETIATSVHDLPAPHIALRMLTTAPPQRPPRMLWALTTSDSGKELESLKDSIHNALAASGMHPQEDPATQFIGHSTLAHFNKGYRIAEHTVVLAHELMFQPQGVTLMESRLEHDKAHYTALRSIDFKSSV